MKCILQVVNIEILLIIVFDCLNGRQLALVDLARLIGSDISEMSTLLIVCLTFLMKLTSSSLFFAMEYLNELIFSSSIAINTIRGT